LHPGCGNSFYSYRVAITVKCKTPRPRLTLPGRHRLEGTITIRPENTTFGGKMVKALRLYPAQNDAALEPPSKPPEAPVHNEMSDEIPW
jgi:hypothetical protein